MQDKIKVICFLDNPLGRDTEIVLPVTFCMEEYYDCEVTFLFLWDMLKIKFIKPDIILLPNTRGHNVYFEIAKFGHQCGITILALDSEGNIRTDGSHSFWGYMKDETIYQEVYTCWSERVKNYLEQIIPHYQQKLVVTGATGFDRYVFERKLERESFLKKYDLQDYQKVVGYAGWAFGKIFGREKSYAMAAFHPSSIELAHKWVGDRRIEVREILRKLILANPDTLFIFKKHPKESFEDDIVEHPNEMNELTSYANVKYFKLEEDIKTLISISDVWTGFETTTLIEAWLSGKPTLLINPQVDFPRVNLYTGSLICKNYEEVQGYLTEYFNKGTINAFHSENLNTTRQKLIADAIGYEDGLNHLRAIRAFIPFIKKKNKISVPLNWRHLRLYVLMHFGQYFFSEPLFKKLPGFKKSIYVFKNRGLPKFAQRKVELYGSLRTFHESKEITKDFYKY